MTAINGLARLGTNPELKYVTVGDEKKPVCEINARFINGKQDKATQEWEDQGFWVQINVWGKCAEPAAKMFASGDKITVDGNMVMMSWPDKDDPEKMVSGLKVDANSVSPYLPDLVSLEYKERKSRKDSQATPAANNQAQANTSTG